MAAAAATIRCAVSGAVPAAERVGMVADQERMTEELHEIFTMQIPIADGQQAYQGAA